MRVAFDAGNDPTYSISWPIEMANSEREIINALTFASFDGAFFRGQVTVNSNP
jgi:hypothetical protein